MEEDAQQRITYLLQEIDANICAAHRSATQICGTVRRHHQILRQIHEVSQVWRPLFASFTQQPAARRATRTPSRLSRPFTPVSRATTRRDGDEDEEMEGNSIADSDQTFKTTTLKKHHPRASERLAASAEEDSLNFSITSDNLPRMSRTPYLSKSAARQSDKAQESASTLNSEDHGDWPASVTSPPRTRIISGDTRDGQQPRTTDAAPRQISTPPSVISSVAYNSPGISRNLMKMGAFEYTPPRGKKTRSGEQKEVDETTDSIVTPQIPTFATVAVPDTIHTAPNATNAATSTRASESASNRKRKRSDVGEKHRAPSYPKTHYPVSVTSPYTSPSLRRKYSTGTYSTPSRRRKAESRTSTETTPLRQGLGESVNDDDTPSTPDFDLASPLLRTQLKAMTPNTPLSNRLVGANLDVGSVSQETRLQDYDDSFNAGEPTPKFELALLPAAFQRGVGAIQMSTLYSKFQSANDASKPALSVDQLAEMLPDYGKEKIEILLDTLVSRRLLRPFVVEGTMFWQHPI